MNADTMPALSVSSALTVQGRVIYALVMREVHTLYGNTRLGYLWAIIQTAFNITVFWLFREFLGAHAPHGMGMAVFLLCGFIPWYMFSDTVSRCMKAISANQALLTFPQVTELDLMIARCIVVWGTQLVCAVIILSIAAALGQSVELRHVDSLAATLFFAPLLGLGTGLIFASLARLWPTLERLVPILMRFLFFASGVFFQVSELPARFSGSLLLNPVAQLIEWQRYGFSASSSSPLYSIGYVTAWCLGSLCLGLLLERYVRGREAGRSPRLMLTMPGTLCSREGSPMIELSRICKSYSLPHGKRKDVLRDVSITFRPGVNMGILGLNGQGKSTLIRIISGSERPDSGTVTRRSRVSWPIGFAGGFNGSLTGRENLRFTSRIYGADIQEVTEFVEEFTELGPYMDMPVKTYSSGMRSKLAFGLSMSIGFDFYLIDEAWSVGDASFRAKAEKLFEARKAHATLVVVSHNVATIRKNCDRAAVLHDGVLSEYETLGDALRVYTGICHAGR